MVPGHSGQRPGTAEAAHLAGGCVARMRDLFPEATITIGIGGACRDPAEIARSYGQARRTIDAVVRLGGQSQVVAFEDLGIHRLLLQIPDLAELRSFATEVLGELGRQERPRGAELLATLACYLGKTTARSVRRKSSMCTPTPSPTGSGGSGDHRPPARRLRRPADGRGRARDPRCSRGWPGHPPGRAGRGIRPAARQQEHRHQRSSKSLRR